MTLNELKERVDWAVENNKRDLDVCIPNNKNGIGGTSVTFVRQAAQGIDWDSGRFIIYPEEKMVNMKEEPEELTSLINYVRKETGMGKVQSIKALEECKEEIGMLCSNWLRKNGKKTSNQSESVDAIDEEADKQSEQHANLFPLKHDYLSEDECGRIKDVARGSYYIGYKDGYKKAKTI